MITVRRLAAALIALCWSGAALAGLIRYDVTMAAPGSGGGADAYGFMVFQDPVFGGDILPYLVDWEFHEPLFGLTLNVLNAAVDPTYAFIVDTVGRYVSHELLCFGLCNDGSGGTATLLLSNGSTFFVYPGGAPIVGYHAATFSEPKEVPLPATLSLLTVGLLNLALKRRWPRKAFTQLGL